MNFLLKRSVWGLIYLSSLHLMAIIVLIILPIPLWLKWMGLLLIVSSFIFYCWRYQWIGRNENATCALRIDQDERWLLITPASAEQDLSYYYYLRRAVAFRHFIMLYFKTPNHRFVKPVLVMSDSCIKEDWRQLNIIVRQLNDEDK